MVNWFSTWFYRADRIESKPWDKRGCPGIGQSRLSSIDQIENIRGRNLDVVGIGGLAYQIFIGFQQKRKGASVELGQVDRFVRAIVLELRVTVNLLDLALKAEEAGDHEGRNGILSQIECPLLSAVGMGMDGIPITKAGARTIVAGLSHSEFSGDQNSRVEEQDCADRDLIDHISLMVSRLLTVQALAKVGSVAIEINWSKRISKLRYEALDVLKSVLASANGSDS